MNLDLDIEAAPPQTPKEISDRINSVLASPPQKIEDVPKVFEKFLGIKSISATLENIPAVKTALSFLPGFSAISSIVGLFDSFSAPSFSAELMAIQQVSQQIQQVAEALQQKISEESNRVINFVSDAITEAEKLRASSQILASVFEVNYSIKADEYVLKKYNESREAIDSFRAEKLKQLSEYIKKVDEEIKSAYDAATKDIIDSVLNDMKAAKTALENNSRSAVLKSSAESSSENSKGILLLAAGAGALFFLAKKSKKS